MVVVFFFFYSGDEDDIKVMDRSLFVGLLRRYYYRLF